MPWRAGSTGEHDCLAQCWTLGKGPWASVQGLVARERYCCALQASCCVSGVATQLSIIATVKARYLSQS